MTLPVRLTDDEKLQRAKRVAVLERDGTVLEEQRKEQNTAMKAKIEKVRGELGDLCHQLRTGEELREVEVRFVKDIKRKVEETVRADTGEVVETRKLGPRELQSDMFEEEDGPVGTPEERLAGARKAVQEAREEIKGAAECDGE